MSTTHVNTSTFTLNGPSGLVSGTVTYNTVTNTATFTSAERLVNDATYTATITTGVKDLAGNSVASNYSWGFTTGSAASTLPSSPTDVNAVGSDGQITISWSAISGMTYNLYMASVSGVTKSTYSLLPDGMAHSGVISPYLHTGLANGKTYYFVVTAVDGNGESSESSQVTATPNGSYVYQPGNDTGVQDIWTTSVYSYTGAGGGPGGGLNNERLRVGGWGDLYYSLIRFDSTNLPQTVSKVELQLFMPQVTGFGTTELYLDAITASWDWRTGGTGSDRERLWWADRPTAEQWISNALPAPIAGEWYAIDITSLYNAWQSGTPNYGVQLRPVSNSNTWAEFNSSNHPILSLRPRLLIVP